MNKVILVGNLTRDVEEVKNNDGVIAKMTIAVNDGVDAKGEKITDFVTLVAFGKVAERCIKYISKGSKVAVSGKIHTRSWEAQDGSKRYATEVIVRDIEFCGTSKKGDEKIEPVDDDNLPF